MECGEHKMFSMDDGLSMGEIVVWVDNTSTRLDKNDAIKIINHLTKVFDL